MTLRECLTARNSTAIFVFVTGWLVACSAAQCADQTLITKIRAASVTILVGEATGSGVMITRADQTYVWTAAHVIRHAALTDADGKTAFGEIWVMRSIEEAGETVGQEKVLAEVLHYEDNEDLAILRLAKKDYTTVTIAFYLDAATIALGTDLWHIGSVHGENGAGSVSRGVMSKWGRKLEGSDTIYDQTTVNSAPGCSGGGVFLEDGRCIGLLVMVCDGGISVIVPARRMHSWAGRMKALWAIDPSVPTPVEE